MRVLSVFSRRITGPAIALINVMKGLSDLGIVVDVLGSPDAPYAHFFTELAEHDVKIHNEPFVWYALAEALLALLRDEKRCHRYGEAGRKWAENFSPHKVASQYLEVYEAVARK